MRFTELSTYMVIHNNEVHVRGLKSLPTKCPIFGDFVLCKHPFDTWTVEKIVFCFENCAGYSKKKFVYV